MWNHALWRSDEVMGIKVNQCNEMVKVELHDCFEYWLIRKKCSPR